MDGKYFRHVAHSGGDCGILMIECQIAGKYEVQTDMSVRGTRGGRQRCQSELSSAALAVLPNSGLKSPSLPYVLTYDYLTVDVSDLHRAWDVCIYLLRVRHPDDGSNGDGTGGGDECVDGAVHLARRSPAEGGDSEVSGDGGGVGMARSLLTSASGGRDIEA
ncbi:hypothetical protein Tco_0102758 [Tanacetum coccineum]